MLVGANYLDEASDYHGEDGEQDSCSNALELRDALGMSCESAQEGYLEGKGALV